jgi:hypothetical protein
MESRSAQTAAFSEFWGAGAFSRLGAAGRLFHMVARHDRMGGLAPSALLRGRLSLRHALLKS